MKNQNIWPLKPDVTFLNHGSFGSCPRPVLEFQQALRDRLESQPVQFMVRELEPMLDDARSSLAQFIGASPDNVVFVPNATSGVNTVLRSLNWKAGDELIVTDHQYNACRNALDFVAGRVGAKVVPVSIPFPLSSDDEIINPIINAVTPNTRLALLDHITSPTGIIFPISKIIDLLKAKGVDTLVDGAHSAGMVPLNLSEMAPTYFTGNCHKWLCTPKGAAFLYVAPSHQNAIRPLTISHGANSSRSDRSRFQIEFAWTGTDDPTAYLSIPESIRFLETQMNGGWPAIMDHNHKLALFGRDEVCRALQIDAPCPDHMIGSIASAPLPDSTTPPPASALADDPLLDELLARFNIEAPIRPWPTHPRRLIRISAQLYNSPDQYQYLAKALQQLL